MRPGIEWLDIGCGRQVTPEWAWKPGQKDRVLSGARITGLDVDEAIHENPHLIAKLIGTAEKIPVPAESFDLVTANMVMEHVQEPAKVLGEVRRVLRNGGRFVVHTPNRRYYLIAIARLIPQRLKNWIIKEAESRKEQDIFPTFYRFNTPEVVTSMSRDQGFAVEDLTIAGPYPNFWETRFAPLEKPMLALLQRKGMARYRSTLVITLKKSS
jgi:ubiquinone/menaquinone biosynthesis C-methylase UbiE